MSRIVTHAELVAVPDGGVYQLEEGAELTPLAGVGDGHGVPQFKRAQIELALRAAKKAD